MKRQSLKGFTFILLASILWGIAGALAKVIFNLSVSPLELTVVRSIVAAVILFLLILAFKKPLRVTKQAIQFLVIQGIILSAIHLTFYYSISKTNVAIAVMLQCTAPIFVIVFDIFANNYRMNFTIGVLLIISVFSCSMLVGVYNIDFLKTNFAGICVGILCGISFAFYNIWGKRGHSLNINTWTMTFYSFLFSSIIWLFLFYPINLFSDKYTLKIWAYFIFIGIFATILPNWLYLEGLRYINAFPATIIGMLEPVSAGIVAFMLLKETLEPLQLIGMAGICGVILYLKKHNELLE
ncbi:DMT family transporter [Nostoc sp. CHAB 5784]|uniref:DMT family transporter n=1 Tax=Nostoc mirabile TaxID=2907820 RepID=UPI001E65DB7E|nr:EamA family transporter [Nostoc mirabile]MCC5662406.1 DMT family transporter [Nostoc mirabile CHAB5784]